MRKILVFIFAIIFFTSCSKDKNNIVFELFSDIATADSLYREGEITESMRILDNVLNCEIPYVEPTLLDQILDKNKYPYSEYLYSSLAQLDALEMLHSLENDNLKKTDILKRLFILFPKLNTCIDNNPVTDLGHHNIYTEYKIKVNPPKKKETFQNLPTYIYQRKWEIINNLLIELDENFGYDVTFQYFDSIFVYHGSCMEEYTKVLAKTYMSFSGHSKYKYQTDMDYSIFKSIIKSRDKWITVKFEESNSIFSSNKIMNHENEGLVIQCDSLYLYSPSLFYPSSLTAQNFTTINGISKSDIKISLDIQNNLYARHINLDKPLLCALLYKHGYGNIASKLLETKQYNSNDTIIREGFENGIKKIVCYNDNLSEIEWRLYTEDGHPVSDSTGTHKYNIEYYEDSIVEHYYGADLLPRKTDHAIRARVTKEINGENNYTFYYYNWNSELISKHSDNTFTFYKKIDNNRIVIEADYKNNFTTHTTYFGNNITPLNHPILSKEVRVYNDLYYNSLNKQFGNLTEIRRFNQYGSYYMTPDLWSMETFLYDEYNRIIEHKYFDNNLQFKGGKRYVYILGSVEIQYYDSQGKCLKKETSQ